MSWLITVLLAIVLLAVLLPALLLLLVVIDPPRTEEGWRRELASTGGLEHIILTDAYRICHHRKGRKDAKKEQHPSRQAVAGSQSLYARGGPQAGTADSRVGGHLAKPGHDDHNHELFRGSRSGVPDPEVQGSPSGAGSEGPSTSSRPADEQRENRPSDPANASQSVAFQAGSGGREGGVKSLMGEYDAPFWKKLVAHAEELGL